MLVSLNWIKQYIDLPPTLTGEEIAQRLTLATVEVESVEYIADRFDRIRVGRVTHIEPHPKADRLQVVDVSLGDKGEKRVVCGGTNVYVDQVVALAEPGSFVRWHGEGETVEIKKTTLRGVASDGMICASSELGLDGLFPQTSETEILDLGAIETQPGQALVDALCLADVLFEIDNKSLTNRPDLWGHYGLARELAALYEIPLRALADPIDFDLPQGFPVDLPDSACRRYAALSIDNVDVDLSPLWMRTALWAVGVRPMTVPVDITNYVMLTTGQPSHAFDADRLNAHIRVRRAKEDEQLTLLNGETLTLSENDLLITDKDGPLGMAGIMGGEDDSIHADTNRVLLEVANFDPIVIRRSGQQYGLRTEASARFEKNLDTQRVDEALALSVHLFEKLIPSCRVTALTDVQNDNTANLEIEISLDFLQTRLGRLIEANEAAEKLERLGFIVDVCGDNLLVHVPSWRATGDVEQRDDVLEEVARIIGYSNFPYQTPKVDLGPALRQPHYHLIRRIRETMAFRYGFQEIFTYPWVADQYCTAAGLNDDDAIRLSTPPSPEQSRLRASLIPGLLESVVGNLRWYDQFKLFELTQVFSPKKQTKNITDEPLPVTRHHLGGALVGSDGWLLYRQAKGILESLSRHAQFTSLTFQADKATWADPAVCQSVFYEGRPIGQVGLLKPQAARQADIKFASVVLFELDVDALVSLPSRENRFQPLPAFPLVDEDLSVLVDEQVSWQQIRECVGPLVRRLSFIDEYRGPQVDVGKKSVTFRLWLESKTGTLTADEIKEQMQAVTAVLENKLGADIRKA